VLPAHLSRPILPEVTGTVFRKDYIGPGKGAEFRSKPVESEVFLHSHRLIVAAAIALLSVAACTPAALPPESADPYEVQNRAVFDANRDIDSAAGLSGGSGGGVPVAVTRTVANLAGNLEIPGIVVNDLLQGAGENALHNTFRFILNTTLGVGGLFDPALSFGLEARDNDFGKTLHVWGVSQGNYLVLPVLGPSTERDLAGKVVDAALNPLGFWLPRDEMMWARGLKVADLVGSRLRYSDAIDSVIYDSADPYAQARSVYLQNRNFELTGGTAEETYIDPYEVLDAQ